ncbi:unnamed protein product [Ectocarpus sp. 12 AP-2014]
MLIVKVRVVARFGQRRGPNTSRCSVGFWELLHVVHRRPTSRMVVAPAAIYSGRLPMMQGASSVSSQYTSLALTPSPQHDSQPRPASAPAVRQPSPAHWPQPTGQHTTLFASLTPSRPLLHVVTAFRDDT